MLDIDFLSKISVLSPLSAKKEIFTNWTEYLASLTKKSENKKSISIKFLMRHDHQAIGQNLSFRNAILLKRVLVFRLERFSTNCKRSLHTFRSSRTSTEVEVKLSSSQSHSSLIFGFTVSTLLIGIKFVNKITDLKRKFVNKSITLLNKVSIFFYFSQKLKFQ